MSTYFLLDESSGGIIGHTFSGAYSAERAAEKIAKPDAPVLICRVEARVTVEMRRELNTDRYVGDALPAFAAPAGESEEMPSDGIEVQILASAGGGSGSEPASADDVDTPI